MPEEPRPESTAYTRTLKRAADTLGGAAQLARALDVPLAELERWLAGESRPPQDIFLASLDIVAEGAYESRADQAQRAADRSQAAADRAQSRADRYRGDADRLRRAKARPEDEKLRGMGAEERRPASNAPAEEQKKKEG